MSIDHNQACSGIDAQQIGPIMRRVHAHVGKHSFKKIRNFMKTFHKRGRGGVNRISYLLFRTTYVPEIRSKILNKDFIKAVRGGGRRFVKLFHKIPDFFKGMLP